MEKKEKRSNKCLRRKSELMLPSSTDDIKCLCCSHSTQSTFLNTTKKKPQLTQTDSSPTACTVRSRNKCAVHSLSFPLERERMQQFSVEISFRCIPDDCCSHLFELCSDVMIMLMMMVQCESTKKTQLLTQFCVTWTMDAEKSFAQIEQHKS